MFQVKPFSFLLFAALVSSLVIGLTGSPKLAVGDVEVQLHPNEAPLSVANFLSYVNAPAGSNYDGSFIHRAVPNFVVQGGGFYLPVDGVVDSVPVMTEELEDEFGMPVLDEFGMPVEVPITATVRPINGFSTLSTTLPATSRT